MLMKGLQPLDPAMVEAARELYLKYSGRQHVRIEREMCEAGWPFYRSMLYTTGHECGLSPGWIERFGWTRMLPEEDRKRLRKRNYGRNYFEHWLREEFPEWNWSWKYQRFIYHRLHAMTTGRSRRLMIFMPPRHGKSEMVTIRYTTWRLLQEPSLNVILGSYNQKLANKFSRRIRRLVENGELKMENSGSNEATKSQSSTINSRFRRSAAVSEWETLGGGVVRSVGVGAGIAGFGAGLIVIDDPVKNRAEAESEAFRDRVWEWFNDDIYTRMEPNASIILIQTRWHEDDLAGRLLKEMKDGGEQWDVISLAALAEEEGEKGRKGEGESGDPLGRKPGHALCPKRFPAKTLLKYQKKLGSYSFSAMYQQRPSPAEGGKFKRAWFRKVIDAAPEGFRGNAATTSPSRPNRRPITLRVLGARKTSREIYTSPTAFARGSNIPTSGVTFWNACEPKNRLSTASKRRFMDGRLFRTFAANSARAVLRFAPCRSMPIS